MYYKFKVKTKKIFIIVTFDVRYVYNKYDKNCFICHLYVT